jgi:hypothetical protein
MDLYQINESRKLAKLQRIATIAAGLVTGRSDRSAGEIAREAALINREIEQQEAGE